MTIKIKGALPKGDKDGLMHLTDQLRHDHRSILAVVVLAPYAVTERLDDESDEYIVHCEILHIEAPQGSLDRGALNSMIADTYSRRTGKQPLPFGTVLDFDPATGEILRAITEDPAADDEDGQP